MRHLLPISLVAILALPVGLGQEPPPEVEDTGLIITTESNLVLVPLHVYRKKSSVNGLGSEAFELFEDGQPQRIAFVEGPAEDGEMSSRTVPTEIIFLIDFSYSVMTPGLLDFTTIRSTMLEGLRKDVMISIYGFAAKLKRFTGPTRDVQRLQRALDQTFESEAGGSRVYEAIMQTARDASSRGPNVSRMMVVFSDGLSTTNLNPDLPVGAANAFGIPIYPVVLGHERIRQRAAGLRGQLNPGARMNEGGGQPNPANSSERVQVLGPNRNPVPALNRRSNSGYQENLMRIFAEFGPRTGGRSYDLPVLNNMVIRKILGSLSELAETEYVVGYYPSQVDEQKTPHMVEVRLSESVRGTLYGGRRMVVH
ncbi:MAG: VWA domain-containing protein [Bryobacterales bacterium]|nr:VWA domain-containing protein [Bryobacterales bacterium]